MGKKDQEQLWAEEFQRLKKEISEIGIFRNGSISKRWQTCGNSRCRCKRAKEYRHGPYYWWTTKEKTKTRAILVPSEMLDEAYVYIENSRLLRKKMKILAKLADKIVQNRVKKYREKSKKH